MVLGCLLRWPGAGLAGQIAAGLDRDTIYLGTQTLLTVEVANSTSAEWPVVSPVDGLQITPYQAPTVIHDLNSGSVRRSYHFLVNPLRADDFTIASVTVGEEPDAMTAGPFTLRVLEAPLKFLSAQVEPEELRVGEKAILTVRFQGVRPGKSVELPKIEGLALRDLGLQRVEMTRQEGIPISVYRIEVIPSQQGKFQVEGISLDGVTADPVALQVSRFVVAGTQVGGSSLVVGGRTRIQMAIRGLGTSEEVKLVAPAGLKIEPVGPPRAGMGGTTIFTFEVTATEPGAPTIRTLQLADGTTAPLPRPITLMVRTAGEGGILAGRGTARSEETVVGEPFIVDYEVFFRGDLQAAAIDLEQADFARRPYVQVEPVNELAYPDWTGQAFEVGMTGNRRAVMLLGSGELDGQREQMLRFALKITPLAVGELELKGVRVIMRLQIKQEQRSGGMFFSSTRMQDFDHVIDVPPHKVIDPPGKQRPAGYRGVVGASLAFTTSLDRTTATAMSPLTLTLKIAGQGVGPDLAPPVLAEIPELTRDFDVSSSLGGGEVEGDAITFTQVVRPRSEQVKEFPALPLVYYDYLKKDYETIYSLPIPITVTPGGLVGATAMQTRSDAEASASPEARAVTERPAESISLGANHTTLGKLSAAPPLGPGGVLAVLLAGPLAILAVWTGLKWHERFRPAASIRRQRRELIAALERVEGNDRFHAELAELVQACLRLTFGLPAGEVSMDRLAQAMNGRAVDDRLRQDIEALLKQCDAGRFAAAGVEEAERRRLLAQARELFDRLSRV